MSRPLADKIALVTGASRGIGNATARALARAGAHVVAVARTTGALEELDDAIRSEGSEATLVPLDLKDMDGIARLALALHERYQRLDILVGNAGILGPLSPLGHIEPKDWDAAFAINVTANWQLIRTLDPLLRAAPAGRAVFLTSGVAAEARAYWGLYAATKSALETIARTYAAESVTTNLRVNLFSPGPTRTKMHATAYPGIDPETLPTPEAIAEKLIDLCLPGFTETGKLYSVRAGKLLGFNPPS